MIAIHRFVHADVITLRAGLDDRSAPALAGEAMSCLRQCRSHLVLDLTEVEYIRSAGLRLLLALLREAKASGKQLTLAGASERVRLIFEVTGADELFRMAPSLGAALDDGRPVLACS